MAGFAVPPEVVTPAGARMVTTADGAVAVVVDVRAALSGLSQVTGHAGAAAAAVPGGR